ncbi:hydantoinase/oxoprolinase family protein [Roseovarius pacificus]|uniref:hydantoinase/oxoprolinase family protein n=1 Tax=Roseovarius pacificus TaxID=337701 RepID=UPI002A188E42|nr:hydantoinase/oxoprolinase family protein [Roseovarius pacificus]
MSDAEVILGADCGGTFTDVLALDAVSGAIIAARKVPSTPMDPGEAVLDGMDRYIEAGGRKPTAIFHGTTVGTNALIERKGVNAALLTTRGFRDVIALRRQARPRLYDLAAKVCDPLISRERRVEVQERICYDGSVKQLLTDEEVARVVAEVEALGVEAVAISLMHAYANDQHERKLAEAIAAKLPDVYLTLSSDICREFREFERTSTTAVNAYIGPTVSRYMRRLNSGIAERGASLLSIMKSNGGLTSSENASKYPAQLIESGPAAGVIAVAELGLSEGFKNLIAFDMGGTTAKVGVVQNGRPRLSSEFIADQYVDGADVGGFPIKSPAIDIIEIGAGGGSVAWIDAAGALRVGPESAGAVPGPACYGRGGDKPTVTDAHVILGHIDADGFGSEDLSISRERAAEAMEKHIATPLGWTIEEAAEGVLRLATAAMTEMVRLATLRRGLDPRDFSMVAFGGAGPLHAAEIAKEAGLKNLIIPPYPGLFSAIGTVLGDRRHDLVQTHVCLTKNLEKTSLNTAFDGLEKQARVLIANEDDNQSEAWIFERSVDLRYEGQLLEMNLPAPESATGEDFEQAFRAAYRADFGYDLEDNEVELVAVRMVARLPVWKGGWPTVANEDEGQRAERTTRQIHDKASGQYEALVIPRNSLTVGERQPGPAIIEDFGATIRVLVGQKITVSPSGVIVVQLEDENTDG